MPRLNCTSNSPTPASRTIRLRRVNLLLLLLGIVVLGAAVMWVIVEHTPLIRGYVAHPSYLRDAAVAGDVGTVNAILHAHPELVNAIWGGSPPLYDAVQAGRLEVAQSLIEHGADVNFATPRGRLTPIMGACLTGRKDCARLLLEAGADVNALDSHNETALDIARDDRDGELIDLLKKYSAKSGGELATPSGFTHN